MESETNHGRLRRDGAGGDDRRLRQAREGGTSVGGVRAAGRIPDGAVEQRSDSNRDCGVLPYFGVGNGGAHVFDALAERGRPAGFRHAYYDYSPVPDYFLMLARSRRPPRSPHSPVLEIAVSAGVLGLLGYALLAASFLARLRRMDLDSLRFTSPYALP